MGKSRYNYLLRHQRTEEARHILEGVAGAEGPQNAAVHRAQYLLQRQAKEQQERTTNEEEKQ